MPTLLKQCVTCKEMRDAKNEFHFNGAYYKGGIKKKRLDCVYCCRSRRAEYFKNPIKKEAINKRRRRNYQEDGGVRRERNRRNSLKQLYGLTIEKYDQMRTEQKYRCAICNIHESAAPKGKLYVDHCHKTKQIRGLLCAKCNSAIGFFHHDPKRIERAIRFLELEKAGLIQRVVF